MIIAKTTDSAVKPVLSGPHIKRTPSIKRTAGQVPSFPPKFTVKNSMDSCIKQVCRTPFHSQEWYLTLSRPLILRSIHVTLLIQNSKGTCFQRTPCIKRTLARVPS